MSEWRKTSGQDQSEWLDEAAAAELMREMLNSAPPPMLHPDGPELLNPNRGPPAFYIEYGLIMGIWLISVAVAVWRWMF
ncbi:hypothetical protein [Novosphingobium humi]|uniref:Uncharacterized protein n=1 Tax=Novosphingobium humi TaxID=2282397 RepID=A0ABY7TS92_9SPHN|nr:hypothetical protein [Novosphingobium humi]WCT76069.1 hypothetical protein PQ457_08895 [Novosphingobium humi]